MITTEEIKRRLWDGANELRGSMDASRYKDYMLGLMFYKFLSDKTLDTFKQLSGLTSVTEAELVATYREKHAVIGAQLDKTLQQTLGYYVLPEYLYQTWLEDIRSGAFEVQKITDSLNHFERTIAITADSDDFKGLFSGSTLDLTNTALGSNLNERSKSIKALILLFADLNMVSLQKGDILGDAYEYLIGQFAMESGAKAGEFYTPQQVSEVMAQIVAKTQTVRSIYDPTVGSGSLLLTVKKHLSREAQRDLTYYGQEKNTATYNLTRMNLLLHGVRPEKMVIKNGDTLGPDWPEDPSRPDEGVQFDAVVMNPPYSAKNWNRFDLKVSDPRFEMSGVLPPDSKGDYAFLLHGLYHLGTEGTMAIVLPHGVLFRGGAEGDIRQRLLEKNQIDAVIGLPGNLFTNTPIPVNVMILKKNRPLNAPVLLIDASNHFIKVGKQNVLQEKDIAKIVDTYTAKHEEAGYSCLATREMIIANDYNLNIPRYVEALATDIAQDVEGHLYGGIPQHNIAQLQVLNVMGKDILAEALTESRPGYVTVNRPLESLSEQVLGSNYVQAQLQLLSETIERFLARWWEQLIQASDIDEVKVLREGMLEEIKTVLGELTNLNTYDGYQIIAALWKETLTLDAELIVSGEFYSLGRTRDKRIVTKGTGKKKREEQDGWTGKLVPNELIQAQLFSTEQGAITAHQTELQTLETNLADLVEAATVEGSEEATALEAVLNETQVKFEAKKVKEALKTVPQDSQAFHWLTKIEETTAQIATIKRTIKTAEKALVDLVENRIETLTNDEIDTLMFIKWFGNVQTEMVNLIKQPLQADIETLGTLQERYAETLTTLDDDIAEMEAELNQLMAQLEVNNNDR
ncbi:type I restriction-modification system subunit M [Brochothrix thermosphacta]|uniref:type I restriction-modification system subunit M n=1 Tax=Brochothrix thermosphacta TaxID=2756 RepID=UPI000D0FEE26|nr:type I restriction-modification system subunit M [Brochothrix thermosphacta]SOC27796.1 Type I restriction-modification system, M subunit [Brochothrix thermosphacta]